MNGFLFASFDSSCVDEDYQAPEADPLQTGYVCYGSPADRTGVAWNDQSSGTCYGGGHRFDTDEESYLVKVRTKSKGG